MRGVYQHCSEKHLHRYLAEFDFRYNHRAALGFTDEHAPLPPSRHQKASGLPIINLVNSSSFKWLAAHFSRWRDRNRSKLK